MPQKKRTYRSPRRREQAEETRRKILDAARTLFVARGYGGATMDAIADAAGVSVQTVYAGLGSKRAILMALLDDMAEDADLKGMMTAVTAAAGDPRRQLRERLAFAFRLYEAGADLIGIARTVSGAEPDLEEMWTEGEARRHLNMVSLVRGWEAEGVLKPDLSVKDATDIFWALAGPDVYRLFVTERGWSRKRFAERMASMLEAELFA